MITVDNKKIGKEKSQKQIFSSVSYRGK